MNIFFSAGEPSGDAHGARLIDQLRQMRPDATFVGFGGSKMSAAGCRLLHDMTPLALMFFWRVLIRLPKFLRLVRQAKQYFKSHRVDAVILIDYPGFNWWVARRAKQCGIPVFYFGVPQLWAWAPWRVRKLRRSVDFALCQLPFEAPWYAERNCPAHYVGHPFFDESSSDSPAPSDCPTFTGDEKLMVLLPGSRRAEVECNAACFLRAAALARNADPRIRVVAACYNELQAVILREQSTRLRIPVEIFVGRTRELIRAARACIACSGSVSLQLLAERKPTVIYFQISRIQWLIKQLLMIVPYITLVNLLWTDDIRRRSWRTFDPDAADAPAVPMPEYLTTRPCPEKLAAHAIRWLTDEDAHARAVDRLDAIARRFAVPGASRRAAAFVLRILDEPTLLRAAA
jgi:lipid-A-disaccharide synthase